MGLTRQQIIMVAVLLTGTFIAVLNVTLLSPALPAIMADMGVDATTVQWLTSGYSLTEAIIIPLSAYIMGRFSTRQVYIGGMVLFALGSLLSGLAPSFGLLLLGRIIQATCTGMVMPMVMSLILLTFPREKRGAGMGLVSLVIGFAPSIGPSLSGLLVDSVGWRMMFIVVFILALAVIVLASITLKNQEGFERIGFDMPSVIMSCIGLLCVLYGLSSFASSGHPLVSLVMVIAGAVVIAFFVRRQNRLEVPMLRVDVLRTRNFRIAVLVMFCIQAALVGVGVLLPLYIQNVMGQSALVTGLVMLPGSLLGAVMGFFGGKLFDRFGARPVALVGSIFMVIGGAGFIAFSLDTTMGVVAVIFCILEFGLQLTITPTNTWGINSLDNRIIHHGNAVINTLNQVGGSLGTAVLVSLSALGASMAASQQAANPTYSGIHLAFFATGILLACVFLIVLFGLRDRKTAKRTAAERAQAAAARATVEHADAQTGVFTLVHEAMNPQPRYVLDTSTIREVTKELARSETSGVPVVSEKNGTVVGFVSDGDVMDYLGRQSGRVADATMNAFYLVDDEDYQRRFKDLLKMNVMQLATKKVISVNQDMALDKATRVLADRRIKKVPVVDEDNRLVGTLSRRNIIQKLAGLLGD
ncbi:MAG: MDR family MFS transporter [Eggerthellaceae bacterium]|jgi:DHA2 family multidrug resistance protein-like MFS transporter